MRTIHSKDNLNPKKKTPTKKTAPKKTDMPKNKGGRPKKPIPEDKCIIAHEFAILGATNAKIAKVLGITVKALEKWMARDKGFRGAIRTGREIPSAKIAKTMYERAKGYPTTERHFERKPIKNLAGDILTNRDGSARYEMVEVKRIEKHIVADVAAAKFVMWNWTKNLPPEERWTDKQHRDHSSGDGTMSPKDRIQPGMGAKEAARLYQQTIREGKVKK